MNLNNLSISKINTLFKKKEIKPSELYEKVFEKKDEFEKKKNNKS